jgi:hypothetical protein
MSFRNFHLLAFALILLLFPSVIAQQPMQFKVGDRVEVDVIMAGAPERSMYKKGTVVGVDEKDRSYLVDVDALPGKLPQQYRIPVRDYGKYWIRAAPGGGPGAAAPAVATDKLRVDDNGTVLADREILDCEHLTHPGRNGSPLPVELAKKLIRCTIERPAQPGMDGAQIMDITEFTAGPARKWKLYEDMGQGSLNTLVYPVLVEWNQKTFYRSRNLAITGKVGMFTCFVDNTGLWQCGSAAGPHKEGKTQEIRVTK